MNINTKCMNRKSRNTLRKWQNKTMFVMRTRNIQRAVTISRLNWISSQMYFIYWYEVCSMPGPALHWMQLRFWAAVRTICAVHNCIASHTDSYQKRIWIDICDVWPSVVLIVFALRIRAQIGDFICVLWVDRYNKFVIHMLLLDTEWTFLVHLTFWTVLVFFSLFSISLVCLLGYLENGKIYLKIGQAFFFSHLYGSWMLFWMHLRSTLSIAYQIVCTLAMLHTVFEFVGDFEEQFKRMLNAYCIIGRIAHGNAFRCAFLDSEL